MELPLSPPRVSFGLFEFNRQTGEFLKQGVKVKLGRQPLKILALLLERPGRLRTRDEIRHQLWGSITFVNFEQSINKAVHQLREAIGDPASNPRYIETVAGSGYRFIYFAQQSMRLHQPWTRKLPFLAVLPFSTDTTDEMKLLNKRVVHRIIDNIAGEPGIRVLPHATVQHCWEDDLDPQRVGQILLVDLIATGEIIRQNDSLYLHADLIDVGSGTQLWGAEFKQVYSDALTHPERLAAEICDQLRPIVASKASWRRRKQSVRAA
jgi:DNA-binding winged helix-turn-helix (wHTH) protein/TolB-like protein